MHPSIPWAPGIQLRAGGALSRTNREVRGTIIGLDISAATWIARIDPVFAPCTSKGPGPKVLGKDSTTERADSKHWLSLSAQKGTIT